jgi:hypothetical protein
MDLVEEFRRLPADSVTQMFIGLRVPGHASGTGHYTVEGNRWVARQIHRRLLSLPGVAVRLPKARANTRPLLGKAGQTGWSLEAVASFS